MFSGAYYSWDTCCQGKLFLTISYVCLKASTLKFWLNYFFGFSETIRLWIDNCLKIPYINYRVNLIITVLAMINKNISNQNKKLSKQNLQEQLDYVATLILLKFRTFHLTGNNHIYWKEESCFNHKSDVKRTKNVEHIYIRTGHQCQICELPSLLLAVLTDNYPPSAAVAFDGFHCWHIWTNLFMLFVKFISSQASPTYCFSPTISITSTLFVPSQCCGFHFWGHHQPPCTFW